MCSRLLEEKKHYIVNFVPTLLPLSIYRTHIFGNAIIKGSEGASGLGFTSSVKRPVV